MGFELRMRSRLEAQDTALFQDLHDTTDEVAPRALAFVVAFDGRFSSARSVARSDYRCRFAPIEWCDGVV
jgi:hypothetical protein